MPSRQHVASYEVAVDGQAVEPEIANRIKEIRVVDNLRLPDLCTFSVTFPQGKDIDNHPFEIGKTLEIRLGARKEMEPTTLFKGAVVTVEVEFGTGGCSVHVRAFDKSHLLHRSRKVRTFQNQTASDIVRKVIQEGGLREGTVEASGAPYDFVQQNNESDWDFVWRLAERAGFEFVVSDDEAHFRRPSPEGAVALEYPDTLRAFKPCVTAVQQATEVTVRAHDPKTKQVIDSRATTPEQIAEIGLKRDKIATAFGKSSIHVATEPVKTVQEGTALAQALLDKLANGYIAAEGVAAGNPRIKAGTKLEVTGVGTRFSGVYRVATSTHVLRGGGQYVTHFANSPSHTILGAVGSNGSNGAQPPDFGSQIVLGVVTNNDDKELKAGRVRVKYPALSDKEEGTWARIATVGAGKDRGVLMMPQQNEEVLIAFEHGDTTRPYILGSLFNGKDLPGDDLTRKMNGSFAVASDTEVFLQCKEDMTFKTKKKLIVETSDDVDEKYGRDWNNKTTGKATLEAQSYSIEGTAQVKVSSTGTITLECGASKIQISSAGITISGPMVSVS